MITFKCKMCGGDLNLVDESNICECEFCGTQQTIPHADNEKKANLFNRANRLRMGAEFDKAATVYSSITAEFPEEAEAYWGLCLCKYGIEYVDDPMTGNKIPTCHRTVPESILDDSDFEQACENADPVAKRLYREEAKAIDRLQQEILNIVANEAPYDVFICYKETTDDGERTEDSVLAQEIYDALSEKDLKVFFSRISLEDKLGQQYEPYIFAALQSAKVMIAVGTQYDYFDAVWVKNEWARFLSMMRTEKGKALIPCFKNIDAYDMPREFKNLQAQDMGKIGWLQDLTRGVLKLVKPKEEEQDAKASENTLTTENPTISNLLTRANIFLEQKDQEQAKEYFNRVLDTEPKNVDAYIGLLLADRFCTKEEHITTLPWGFPENKNFNNALRFSEGDKKKKLEGLITTRERNDKIAGTFFWYFDCAKMSSCWKDIATEQFEFIAALFLALSEVDNEPVKPDVVYHKLPRINPEKYEIRNNDAVFVKGSEQGCLFEFMPSIMGYFGETGHKLSLNLGISEPLLTGKYEVNPSIDILGTKIEIPVPTVDNLCFSKYTDAYKGMNPEDVLKWAEHTEKFAKIPELYSLLSVVYCVFGFNAGTPSCAEKAYRYAKLAMESTDDLKIIEKCGLVFDEISDYQDSKELALTCHNRLDQMEKAKFLNEAEIRIEAAHTEKELDEIEEEMNKLFTGTDIDISSYVKKIAQMRLTIRDEIRRAEEKKRQEEIRKAEEEKARAQRAKAEAERKENKKRELNDKIHRLEQELAEKKREMQNAVGFFAKGRRQQAEAAASRLVIEIQSVKDELARM